MRMHDWVMVEAIGQFPRPEQRGRGVELGEYEDAGLGDGGSNRGRYH